MHPFFPTIVQWIFRSISSWGYLGIFICMVIEGSCIPLPSEIIMPFAGFLVSTGRFNYLIVVLMGGLGNVVGSTLMYYVGKKGGYPFLERFGKYLLISHTDIENAQKWFAKHGNVTVFGCQLYPIFRTYISLLSGILNIGYLPFAIFTFWGASIWSTFLVFLGLQLGKHWPVIEKYFRQFNTIAIGTAVILLVILVIRQVKKYREIKKGL